MLVPYFGVISGVLSHRGRAEATRCPVFDHTPVLLYRLGKQVPSFREGHMRRALHSHDNGAARVFPMDRAPVEFILLCGFSQVPVVPTSAAPIILPQSLKRHFLFPANFFKYFLGSQLSIS